MLWTVVPPEMIYSQESTARQTSQRLICYNGVHAIVEDLDAERLQIVRILSTEPNDYLNSSLTPGTIINKNI